MVLAAMMAGAGTGLTGAGSREPGAQPAAAAQDARFDLLVRGGHVLDPRNKRDAIMDVAIIGGKIAEVARGIDPARAKRVADATGLYVVPGLIDMHAHVFYGTDTDSYLSHGDIAVQPDAHAPRTGVTTVVDAGGAGWRNFGQFKEKVIDRSSSCATRPPTMVTRAASRPPRNWHARARCTCSPSTTRGGAAAPRRSSSPACGASTRCG